MHLMQAAKCNWLESCVNEILIVFLAKSIYEYVVRTHTFEVKMLFLGILFGHFDHEFFVRNPYNDAEQKKPLHAWCFVCPFNFHRLFLYLIEKFLSKPWIQSNLLWRFVRIAYNTIRKLEQWNNERICQQI